MSFSFAHILGPNLGMQISSQFGFETNWYLMTCTGLLACSILYWVKKKEFV
jgi:predicted MFS family arabinose efflux permease